MFASFGQCMMLHAHPCHCFRLSVVKQLSKGPWRAADLTYTDDYTANAVANRYYTGLPGGQVIQPTLNPIATSYQPRVRTSIASICI